MQLDNLEVVQLALRVGDSGIYCRPLAGRPGGKGTIDKEFRVDDGILDVFVISRNPISMIAAAERFFQIPASKARLYYWRGREITVEYEPSKALWADGDEFGRTPVSVKVLPGALPVVVP